MLGRLAPRQGYHQKKKRRIKRVTLICQECGEEYEAYPYEEKTRKFCSRTCSSRNYNRTRIIYTIKEKKCEHCGEMFLIKSFPNKKEQRYCCCDCANKDRAKLKNEKIYQGVENEYVNVCNV